MHGLTSTMHGLTPLGVVLAAVCGGLGCGQQERGPVDGGPRFERQRAPAEFASFRVFDFGVTDVNGDGRLDLFTINHNGRQSILNHGGGWVFHDVYADMGLHQDARHPGLEAGVDPPFPVADTLRVHFRDRELLLTATALSSTGPYRGSLALYGAVRVTARGGFEVDLREEPLGPDAVRTTIAFRPPPDGTLVLKPEFVAAPVELTFDREDPSRRTVVGTGSRAVASRRIELSLRDRHAMAWSDVDDDGFVDVFISRGGLKGALARYPFTLDDELLLRDGVRFRDVIGTWGLDKRGRRGRSARFHDLDGDGRLDLLLGSDGFPLAAYLRRGERFVDSAGALGLGGIVAPVFRVANLLGDGAPEILAAGGDGITLLARDGTVYRAVATFGAGHDFAKIVVTDFDADGDRDVLAVGASRLLLLENADGALQAIDPASVGLPAAAVDAAWVDVENDGDADLFVHPGGLYVQTASRFHRVPFTLGGNQAIASWVDLDGDGLRDPAIVTTVGATALEWRLLLYRNATAGHAWLQVDLRGAAGNREAIGACVEVTAGSAVHAGCVGDAESSLFSQGHHRIYLGLGRHRGPVDVEVRWPDGTRQQLADVRTGRLLRIDYDPT